MTNILRSIAALLTAPILAVATLSACAAPARSIRPALDPSALAQADAEMACDVTAEHDSDLWWDCVLEITTARCEAEGWCE